MILNQSPHDQVELARLGRTVQQSMRHRHTGHGYVFLRQLRKAKQLAAIGRQGAKCTGPETT